MRQKKQLVFENIPKQVSNILNFVIISEQITRHNPGIENGQLEHQ